MAVSAALSGLTANTTYHFRVSATNANGTTKGSDAVFTTTLPPTVTTEATPVKNYTGTGISGPWGITPGPDGALSFANDGNNSIGRISTGGVVANYTVPVSASRRHHDRARWGAVVHQPGQQLHRTDHDERDRHQYTNAGISGPERDHRRNRRGPVVRQRGAQRLDRAGHDKRDRSPSQRRPVRGAGYILGRSPSAPDGALWFTNCRERRQLDRADHDRRGGHRHLHRHRYQRRRRGSPPGRTAPCGSPTTGTTRSGGSPPPEWSPTTPAPASATPRGSRPDRTGPCGSPTTAATRSDGSRPRGWSPTTPAPASRFPSITAGPDGALWFTNYGNNSIGRIAPYETAVTQTTATLHSTVNPNGSSVSSCVLEYGTSNSYGKTAAYALARLWGKPGRSVRGADGP